MLCSCWWHVLMGLEEVLRFGCWRGTPRQVVLLGERLSEVINAVDRQRVAHGLWAELRPRRQWGFLRRGLWGRLYARWLMDSPGCPWFLETVGLEGLWFICSPRYDGYYISLIKRVQTWFPFLFGIVIKKIDRVYLGLDLTVFVYKGSIFFHFKCLHFFLYLFCLWGYSFPLH